MVIAGSPDKDCFLKLEEKINSLKLNNKVFLIGETITGDLKLALYQNAYCFVLPSISENFGYVVLEALASKIPVIISEGVGLKELVYKYNAGLVLKNQNNDNLIRDIVLNLEKLKNLDFVKKLVQNGNKLLESEFNNKILAQKTISFYNEIL